MSPLSRLIRVVVISIIDPHLGESVRVAQNDRAGLRGYVQLNKYTHTHTHTHTHKHTHGNTSCKRHVENRGDLGRTRKKIENKGLVE